MAIAQHEALHRREVGGNQRLHRVGADAGATRRPFPQDIGAEQEREHHSQCRHDREHGIAKCVGNNDSLELSPAARAVRINSEARTASIEARVMRAIGASEKIASVMPGSRSA